jgi:hypothetical protein
LGVYINDLIITDFKDKDVQAFKEMKAAFQMSDLDNTRLPFGRRPSVLDLARLVDCNHPSLRWRRG